MSGILAVWGATCFIILLLPRGETTGVFEVQLTSLINGWGLTQDGLCCRRPRHHNHIRSVINSNNNNAIASYDDFYGDETEAPAEHSGNHLLGGGRRRVEERNMMYNQGRREELYQPDEGESEEEDEEECEGECRTFLRVCLSHLQDPLPTRDTFTLSYMCTFGSGMSPVLGGNTLDPFGMWEERNENRVDPNTLVRIPFTFSWPEAFTVVVEAWDDYNGNRSTADSRHVIARAVQGGRLLPSTLWQNHTTSSTNTDLSFRFRVTCDKYYYGTGCDVLCRESDDSIIGHYACDVNGSRVCLPGWEGESCDRAECSEECRSSHGFCEEPNNCRCHLGWRGAHCSECQTFPDCLHGYCNEAWQCFCHEGWSGSLCNIDNYYCERYRPCQNGGTCNYGSINNYTCSCLQGYGGDNCQFPICYHGYCLNKGLCVMQGGEPLCRCRRGFQGQRCQHAEVTCGALSCQNNGTCTRQGAHFRCLCRPGFTGTWCEDEINECESSPCKHGGVCQDRVNGYHCDCIHGHAGRNCDLALDPCLGYKCFNHGTCVTLGSGFAPSCVCRPEFSGKRCEIPVDPCVGIACLHGGTCLRTGTGSASFHCACANGYTGSVCQIPPPSVVCRDQPCLNGGSCRKTPNGVMMCACLPGFGGALCESPEGTTVSADLFSITVVAEELEEGREETTDGTDSDAGGGGDVEDAGGGIGGESPRNLQVPNSCETCAYCNNYFVLVSAFLTVVLSHVTMDIFQFSSCFHWLAT